MKAAAKRWSVLLLTLALFFGPVDPVQTALPPLRRVNAPYFPSPDHVHYEQSAIFWFGRVSSVENYVDGRVGYDDSELVVSFSVFDRWLWYDSSPTSGSLTDWDAVTLYLDMDGNAGSAPDANAYRFDGQLTWWEDPRTAWQAVYRGNGSGWIAASVPFTTTTGWRGDAPNDDEDDRGWVITFNIPFSSLGLSGPPAQGTSWGLGVVVHDRDDTAGTPIADKVWPDEMMPDHQATWGQLHFGVPTYTPQPAVPEGAVSIRHGLNGATVTDVAVGGTIGNMCPGDSNYIWNQWANFNGAGAMQVNVQNQGDISDWPCFSKYYVTFPLTAVPSGKMIISATLTLHQFGNAGIGLNPGPQPSFIQVLTVGQDWGESTLTWNNAPLVRENITGAWVDPLPAYGGDPGVPRTWDVSPAVAEAYSAGEPLRLALYSADWDYHSGRYLWSSDHDDWNAEARPTLTVAWGEPLATVRKMVRPAVSASGQPVTYTLYLLGNGHALTLTDDLPDKVSAPGPIGVAGSGEAVYNPGAHRITWNGTPALAQPITVTFSVNLLTSGPTLVQNTVVLSDSWGMLSTSTVSLIADPPLIWLPLIWRP